MLHAGLENRRSAARARPQDYSGPRVVVCGTTDCGKSTLCKMLLNWAVRAGMVGDCSRRMPMFVDTDVGQNDITLVGCLAARIVESVTPIGVEEAERQQRELPLNEPLALWFGSSSPSNDPSLFLYLLEVLAAYCNQKMKNDPICSFM